MQFVLLTGQFFTVINSLPRNLPKKISSTDPNLDSVKYRRVSKTVNIKLNNRPSSHTRWHSLDGPLRLRAVLLFGLDLLELRLLVCQRGARRIGRRKRQQQCLDEQKQTCSIVESLAKNYPNCSIMSRGFELKWGICVGNSTECEFFLLLLRSIGGSPLICENFPFQTQIDASFYRMCLLVGTTQLFKLETDF